MHKLKKLVGKNVLAATAALMIGLPSSIEADYIYGAHEQTTQTGFFSNHGTTSGYCMVKFDWNGSTQDQYKRVMRYRSSEVPWQVYYSDSNSFEFDFYFSSSVDTYGSMECYLHDPDWGYEWYHSWSWVSE